LFRDLATKKGYKYDGIYDWTQKSKEEETPKETSALAVQKKETNGHPPPLHLTVTRSISVTDFLKKEEPAPPKPDRSDPVSFI
jgi:hypothetical protein